MSGTGPVTHPPSALALSRRLDWRFLLPGASLGRVAVVGRPDELLRDALAAAGADLCVDDGRRPPAREFDVVVCRGASAQPRARSLVAPGGHLYVEAGSRRSARRAVAALLEDGFHSVVPHAHLPRMAASTEIFPLRDSAAARFAVARHPGRSVRTRAARLVVRTRPAALPGLPVSVLGRRSAMAGDAPAPGVLSVLDGAALDRVGRAPGGGWPSTVLITPRYATSRHVIAAVLGEGGRPQLVVKVPRLAGDSGAVEREARSLAALRAARGRAPLGAPEVLALPEVGERRWLVETAVCGEPLGRRCLRVDRRGCVESVVGWLDELPVAGASTPGDDGRHERLLLGPLRLLGEALAGTEDHGLVARTVEEVEPLREAVLPVVFEHGDLSHPNLVRQDDGRLVVVDWELAEPTGLPAQDLIFFLAYAASSTERAQTVPEQVQAFSSAVSDEGAWGRHELERDAARHGYDRSLLRPLVLACWARQSAHLLLRVAGPSGRTGSAEAVAQLRGSKVMALWRDALRTVAVGGC